MGGGERMMDAEALLNMGAKLTVLWCLWMMEVVFNGALREVGPTLGGR